MILLIGKGPDSTPNTKSVSYAPYVLKSYLDTFYSKKQKDMHIRLFDFDWDVSIDQMITTILDENPAIVGFSTYLWNYHDFIECSKEIKKQKPNVLIVFGGPQVSPVAEEILISNIQIDIITYYPQYGETILLDIVETFKQGKSFHEVGGIYFRNNANEIIKTSDDVVPIDFTAMPSPYVNGDNNIFNEGYKYNAVIETSRGCPFDCGYCYWGHDKQRVDYFSLDKVFTDIDILFNNLKVKQVYFADANFLSSSKRAKAILNCILKIKRQIRVFFEINFLSLTEPVAKLLNKLPDFEFLIAIQTTNLKALMAIGKNRPSSDQYKRKLQRLKSVIPNMKFRIDIMLGLPEDDFNGYMNTLDFALSLEPHYICLNYPVFLLPGTRFFKNKDSLGIRYVNKPPYAIIETPSFSKNEIERALRLTIWIQILTYYYPQMAVFFYTLAKNDGNRMQRLSTWIDEIEKQKDFISPYGPLVDTITGSVSEWNVVKKAILKESINPKTALMIFNTILENENSECAKVINTGVTRSIEILNNLVKNNISTVTEADYNNLGFDKKYGKYDSMFKFK